MHMYRTYILQILATRFDRFLGVDNATLHRSKATDAWIYVEIDLTDDPIQGFPIVVANKKFWQEVRYKRPNLYYTKCWRQGHTSMVCRVGEGASHRGREDVKGTLGV
jgi:hypothetical protein